MYYVIEGTEQKVVIKNNKFTMPPDNIAIFINLKEIQYTIKYSLEGGEFANTPASSYTINTPTFNLPQPSREGYNFIGWTDKTTPAPILNYTVVQGSAKNINVTANWEIREYNVTVDTTGQGSFDGSSVAEYKSTQNYTISMSEGWHLAEIYYIKAGDTERVEMGADSYVMPASDITIYVVFEKTPYDITISQEGSYGWIETTQTQSYVGDTVTIIAHPENGCEVVGYKYSFDGGDSWIYTEYNTFVMQPTNVIVCGIFETIEYKINYVLNGGF